MSIFKELAPKYWAVGLPVIPLRPKSKAAFLDNWQRFSDQMPTKDEQALWLREYANGNIGLPLGPCSGLVAIDLDTDDERAARVIEQLLPPSPWIRRGKKGCVMLYRWDEHRTFRVKNITDGTLVECLSKGTQVVLPGSIHPDTGQPYTANCDLWEIKDKLPRLPKDVETVLRRGLVAEGFTLSMKGALRVTEWVAPGARDNTMVGLAGLLARDVQRGHRTLEQAYAELAAWGANYVEKVAGDPIDIEKGQRRILEFLQRDVTEKNKTVPKGWDEGLPEAQKIVATALLGEDSEEWDCERIMKHLADEVFVHERHTAERRRGIDMVLQRLAKSQQLTALDKDMVLQWISQCSGRTMTVSALRKRVEELEGGGIEGTDHTQIAQSLVSELNQFGELRFHADKFWQWKGSHWEPLSRSVLLATIAREFGSMPAARRQSDHQGILKVAADLVAGPLSTQASFGLNFANGYLTPDLQLLPHDPSYGAIYTLPYPYHPMGSERIPQRFMSFLYSCWGKDADYAAKVQALREAIAVTMFGLAPKFQRAICLYGMPHSGKSVLKDIVLGLMPHGTVSSVRPHDWNDKFLPTQLHAKLANFCGELSETELIPGDRFKMIIDGEEIEGQYKGRDIFRFKPTCAHWFATNHMPRTRDSSAGFSRRWLFLTFNYAVPEAERVQNLQEDILAEERDQIAAWAAHVLPEVQARSGYTIPDSCRNQIAEMASLNNSVRYFLVAGGVKTGCPPASKTSHLTSERELHDAYWSFCKTEARAQPVSLRVFRSRMIEMQHEFGFAVTVERFPNGTELAEYANITLAANLASSPSTSRSSERSIGTQIC